MASPILIHGRKFICDLAEILGLQGKPITAIKIDAHVTKATTITVEMIMDIEGAGGLCKIVKEYKLEPIEPPKSWRDETPLL